jgi:hypothetical protein
MASTLSQLLTLILSPYSSGPSVAPYSLKATDLHPVARLEWQLQHEDRSTSPGNLDFGPRFGLEVESLRGSPAPFLRAGAGLGANSQQGRFFLVVEVGLSTGRAWDSSVFGGYSFGSRTGFEYFVAPSVLVELQGRGFVTTKRGLGDPENRTDFHQHEIGDALVGVGWMPERGFFARYRQRLALYGESRLSAPSLYLRFEKDHVWSADLTGGWIWGRSHLAARWVQRWGVKDAETHAYVARGLFAQNTQTEKRAELEYAWKF